MHPLQSTLLSSNIKPPISSLAGSFSYPLDPTLSTGSSAEPSLTTLCRQLPPRDGFLFTYFHYLSPLLDKRTAGIYPVVSGPRSGLGS